MQENQSNAMETQWKRQAGLDESLHAMVKTLYTSLPLFIVVTQTSETKPIYSCIRFVANKQSIAQVKLAVIVVLAAIV